MASERQSLEQLSQIINDKAPDSHDMLYRNSFAVACYLAKNGKNNAASKLISSLFKQLGWDGRESYFQKIIESLEEYSSEYAKEIQANSEINKLLNK